MPSILTVDNIDFESTMALVYRGMKRDADGFPVLGATATTLGVRLGTDIDVKNGEAIVNHKGMSVNPSWREINPFFRPKRLGFGGRGSNSLHCFRAGDGPFAVSRFADGLELLPDPPQGGAVVHGVLRPARTVPIDRYLADIVATREMWQIDEA